MLSSVPPEGERAREDSWRQIELKLANSLEGVVKRDSRSVRQGEAAPGCGLLHCASASEPPL